MSYSKVSFIKKKFRRSIPDLLEIPEVAVIANRHGKTPAQVLLRWIVQRGIATIPKSTNPGRLQQNLSVFDFTLTDEDNAIIRGLDKGIRVCDFDFFQGYVYFVSLSFLY